MKTFRKSSLISSVALLLVAIVALSGATFAWFTANTTATATGISIKSGSASGLLVSANGTDWDSNVELATNTAVLEPGSTSNFTTWYTAKAAKASEYKVDDKGFTADGIEGTNYKKYDLYAKTADGKTMDLTITATTLTDNSDYARIAILKGSDILAYYMNADADTVFPVNEGAVGTAYPATPVNTIENISLGQINGTGTQFTIYVWNEGQDVDCTSLNAEKTAAVDFELKIATPAQAG